MTALGVVLVVVAAFALGLVTGIVLCIRQDDDWSDER